MNSEVRKKIVIILGSIAFILIVSGVILSFINSKDRLKNKSTDSDSKVELKEITYDPMLYFSAMYDNKYLYSNYNKKVYDLKGNLLLDASSATKVEYNSRDGYIQVDNNIYGIDGKLLFDGTTYEDVYYSKGYIVAKRNGKYGLFDLSGNIILQSLYDVDIMVNSNRSATYFKTNSMGVDAVYVYDLKDKKTFGPYVYTSYYSDNMIIVKKYYDDIEKMGNSIDYSRLKTYVLNLNTGTEIEHEELNDYLFNENSSNEHLIASSLSNDKKYGVLNSKFEVKVPFEYDFIDYEDDTLLTMKKGNKTKILNSKYEELIEVENALDIDIENGNIVVLFASHYNYYSIDGSLLYSGTNDMIDYVGNNKYMALVEDKCLHIDFSKKTNKEVEKKYCDGIVRNDYLVVNEVDGVSLYDNNLKKVFDKNYEDIYAFDNYFILKISEQKYEIVDSNGKKLVDKEIVSFDELDGGIVLFGKNNVMYYFNYN